MLPRLNHHFLCLIFIGSLLCSWAVFAQTDIRQTGSTKQKVEGFKAVAHVQVLNQGLPIVGGRVIFSRSVAGRVAEDGWVGQTDETGRTSVDVGMVDVSDSGYYTASVLDSSSSEIGQWNSIPLVTGEQMVLRFAVGEPSTIVSTQPFHSFGVTLDSAMTVVDSVIAGVYLPLKVTAFSHRFANGVFETVVDEGYQGENVRVFVNAGEQCADSVRWRGEGVNDLGDGRAAFSGGWVNGQRQIEVMSTRVLDDFSVHLQAFGGRGKLSGLTVDEGHLMRYQIKALEDDVETTVVSGKFILDVLPTDSWGNKSLKIHRRPWEADSLKLSREVLDSHIQDSAVLAEVFVEFGSNMGASQIPSGAQSLPANGRRFEAVAPNREGSGLVISVRTININGDTASYSRYRQTTGATPELTFLPDPTIPEPPSEPPEAPKVFVVQDYKGASGVGDQGGYIEVLFPLSVDNGSLSHYRIDREVQITTATDDSGKVILLETPEPKWIPWTSLDPIPSEPGGEISRAVIPVTDNRATRWGVAAERKGPNGVVVSSTRTVWDDPVAAINNIAPTAVTNVKWSFQEGAMHVTWDASADDRTVGYINYNRVAIPIKGVVSYEVYRGFSPDNLVLVETLPSGSTSYIDETVSLADANRVQYRVDALDLDNRTIGIPFFSNGTKSALLNREVFIRSFGARLGDDSYWADADLDGDGVIDFADFLLYLKMSGREK